EELSAEVTRCHERIENLLAAEVRCRWRPIHTAPLWERVIIYDPGAVVTKSTSKVFTAVQTDKGSWHLSDQPVKRPTLWCPLPCVPKALEGEDATWDETPVEK